jgi:hypothetical protein
MPKKRPAEAGLSLPHTQPQKCDLEPSLQPLGLAAHLANALLTTPAVLGESAKSLLNTRREGLRLERLVDSFRHLLRPSFLVLQRTLDDVTRLFDELDISRSDSPGATGTPTLSTSLFTHDSPLARIGCENQGELR